MGTQPIYERSLGMCSYHRCAVSVFISLHLSTPSVFTVSSSPVCLVARATAGQDQGGGRGAGRPGPGGGELAQQPAHDVPARQPDGRGRVQQIEGDCQHER